jgi:hypothetical protein
MCYDQEPGFPHQYKYRHVAGLRSLHRHIVLAPPRGSCLPHALRCSLAICNQRFRQKDKRYSTHDLVVCSALGWLSAPSPSLPRFDFIPPRFCISNPKLTLLKKTLRIVPLYLEKIASISSRLHLSSLSAAHPTLTVESSFSHRGERKVLPITTKYISPSSQLRMSRRIGRRRGSARARKWRLETRSSRTWVALER